MDSTTDQTQSEDTSSQEDNHGAIKEFIDSLSPEDLKFACSYCDSKLGESSEEDKGESQPESFDEAMKD